MADRGQLLFSSSAFSPAAARQTSVALLRNVASGDHRLVTSISTRKTTEVLRINLRTGRIELENDRYAESSYETESEALDHLTDRGYEVAERGYALLGYAVAGPVAGVLLATRVREKAVLPGGHTVYAVTDSQWVLVPLQNEAADAAAAAALAGLPPPKQDAEFWRVLQQFTLNNAHYYCETADISRPFPSPRDPRDPNPEFVWNAWLRQPLVELGLYDHCPALLQGAVECSTQHHPGGARFSMCLISRRSRRHPGTRYIARGLNSLAGPGNEIECELLTWTHPEQQYSGSYLGGTYGSSGGSIHGGSSAYGSGSGSGSMHGGSSSHSPEWGGPLRWARVVWRRGTVPIWWGVQLQSLAQGLQAEVYVREEHPYQGTATYFRNVQRQHLPRPALPPSDDGSAGTQQANAAPAPAAAGEGPSSSEGWTFVEGSEGSLAAATQQAAAAAAGAAELLPSGGTGSGSSGGTGSSSEEAESLLVPVTCINLLHANPKKASELMLSSHFQDAMRHVRRRLGGQAPIRVVNFDWHGNMGRLSEEKAVEGFWSLMDPFVKQTGFASGWMEAAGAPADTPAEQQQQPASAPAAAAAAAAPATPWPPGWRMRWSAQQAGLLRFNCADSLDRTNAATCFAMLPVLQEQLRVLGLPLECASAPATTALLRSRQRSSANDVSALAGAQGQAAAGGDVAAELPEGWEVRQHEGRLLYIDHNTKTTQWTPPLSPATAAAMRTGRPSSASAAGGSGSSSSTPLGTRMMQSASDMLARLQRQTASPSVGGGSGSGGSSSSGPKATPLSNLERRSSPPRVPPSSSDHWRRSGSAGSLNGVPHAASAPDMSLSSRPSTASEVPSTPGADRDPLRPWAFFEYDINDVRERLFKDAVGDYVEMFRVHGDIHSFLYTGSPAMHSHVLNLVVQGGKGYGATSGVGKLQNLRVAVQRRWNNTVSDTSRQQAMELFLGLRIHDRGEQQRGYFPALQLGYSPADSQEQLGGMEALESAPLPPPAPGAHSRQPSATQAWGPLGAGLPGAEAAAGAGAETMAAADAVSQQYQQQQQADAEVEGLEDRAHAVPGVPAVEHDGVLGVRQSLLDLEPLPDMLLDEQQQQQPGPGSLPAGQQQQQHQGSRLAHSGSGSNSSSAGGEAEAEADAAPLAAFDPLGAVLHPPAPVPPAEDLLLTSTSGQRASGELINIDGVERDPPAPLARPPSAEQKMLAELEQLLS